MTLIKMTQNYLNINIVPSLSVHQIYSHEHRMKVVTFLISPSFSRSPLFAASCYFTFPSGISDMDMHWFLVSQNLTHSTSVKSKWDATFTCRRQLRMNPTVNVKQNSLLNATHRKRRVQTSSKAVKQGVQPIANDEW